MDGDQACDQPLSLKLSVEITENLARLSTASHDPVLVFSALYPDILAPRQYLPSPAVLQVH